VSNTDDAMIRVEIRITGDGNDRIRVFEAPASATAAGELMTRFGATLPEFKTVAWETGYLADAGDDASDV
jgi:hypothetical protein